MRLSFIWSKAMKRLLLFLVVTILTTTSCSLGTQSATPPNMTPLPSLSPTQVFTTTPLPTINPTTNATARPATVPPPNVTGCNAPTRIVAKGFVAVNPGDPSNIRDAPSLKAAITGTVPPGEFLAIRDNSVCAEGIRWWPVGNEVVLGWAAEGLNGTIWLTPLNSSPMMTTCKLPPRLIAGSKGMVLPGEANVLRDGPDKNGTLVIGEIPASATFDVLGTSLCGTDNRRWWPVRYNGKLGWTAEGEDETYWLAPAS
jgi:hypothetical protein